MTPPSNFLIDLKTPLEIFRVDGPHLEKTNMVCVEDFLDILSKKINPNHYFARINDKVYCMSAILLIPIETNKIFTDVTTIENSVGADLHLLFPTYLFHLKLVWVSKTQGKHVFKFMSKDNETIMFKSEKELDINLVVDNCYVFEGTIGFNLTNIFFNTTYHRAFYNEKPSWM